MAQEKFKPEPSKFKARLQHFGIPSSHLSAHLGYSYPHFLNILNGISRMSRKTEEKLEKFFHTLEMGNDYPAGEMRHYE